MGTLSISIELRREGQEPHTAVILAPGVPDVDELAIDPKGYLLALGGLGTAVVNHVAAMLEHRCPGNHIEPSDIAGIFSRN